MICNVSSNIFYIIGSDTTLAPILDTKKHLWRSSFIYELDWVTRYSFEIIDTGVDFLCI